MRPGPSILFIPVSQKLGSGEYYRCMSLAKSLHKSSPELDLHICVNKHANLPKAPELTTHELDDSPTYCSDTINALITQLKPAVVMFDNTLRAEQIKACKAHGARTIFLSSRPKKRVTGFSPRKLRYLDEHWILGAPDIHHLRLHERLLLKSFNNNTHVRFFAAMQPAAEPEKLPELCNKLGAEFTEYVLFAPGGGSGMIGEEAIAQVFRDAARQFEQMTGYPTLFIAGPVSDVALESTDNRIEQRAVAPDEFVNLIQGSTLLVSGAGSQLWQALVMHKPCVAIPATGKEQPARLANMVKHDVVKTCDRTAEALAQAASQLLGNPEEQARLSQNTLKAGYTEGRDTACNKIFELAMRNH